MLTCVYIIIIGYSVNSCQTLVHYYELDYFKEGYLKNFKSTLSFLMILVLTLGLLAGCSNQETAAPEPKAEDTNTVAVEEASEIVELNYYSHPDEKGERNAMIEAFEAEHPSVKVNLIELPTDTSKN